MEGRVGGTCQPPDVHAKTKTNNLLLRWGWPFIKILITFLLSANICHLMIYYFILQHFLMSHCKKPDIYMKRHMAKHNYENLPSLTATIIKVFLEMIVKSGILSFFISTWQCPIFKILVLTLHNKLAIMWGRYTKF